MRFAAIVLSVLALFALSGAAHARKAPLTDPAPVSIPAGLDRHAFMAALETSIEGATTRLLAEAGHAVDN